ncbi:hypothetical protein CVT24_003933 [Panaeolus cyanescens]|uniref:Uncharacterized protein n=1 Tax=Panaeolus cyanescens TaxID=181874 RepID=A0A409Y6G7_9AGAR|nr:hypothetical protein CVT24_003933 [Panaeolus cyanescens]
MAAALPAPRNESTSNSLYPRSILTEFDFGADNRYPTITTPKSNSNHRQWDPSQDSNSFPQNQNQSLTPSWSSNSQDQRRPSSRQSSMRQFQPASSSSSTADQQQQQQQQSTPEPQRTSLSYALPPGAARRVIERYSLDEIPQRDSSKLSNESKPTFVGSVQETVTGRSRPATPQQGRVTSNQGRISPAPPSLNNPTLPPTISPSNPATSPQDQFPAIMPLSASPTYNPPVSPNHRAYPQQPTYVTPSNQPNAVQQPVYTPIVPQQEEVCVECAMRDQDMADVDVTSPGVWERASDAAYEELKQRELEDEAKGIVVDDPSRPRAKGGRLTEQNLKLWLSINPREPASRQQTLNTYIKSQRTLLEAEALAHARAMQEAKQLDNRMRDAYSQLRRSAYDMGNSASPADDNGGVRIKPPHSPNAPLSTGPHIRSHSREVTLLENGMIVEHVDVRKEEREMRERRKKEEKRARKSSRSSVMDVTSVISAQSNGQLVDGANSSKYFHGGSGRPTSVLTAPLDRPELPQAYSQASFSDVHSMGSSSPRRTRFFGMKNLSAGWRSQDSLAPSGMSGSMVDMHVALQRDARRSHTLTSSPIDLNTPRRSQIWSPSDTHGPNASQVHDDKNKKKKGGLAKIWRIVTGKADQSNTEIIQHAEHDDDSYLAPPPPISYLVGRGQASDLHSGGMRQSPTPSLPPVASPKLAVSFPGTSPPTAPSSVLPSPTSLRLSGHDVVEIADGRSNLPIDQEQIMQDDTIGKQQGHSWKTIHTVASEPELRHPSASNMGPPPPLPTSSSAMLNGSSGNTLTIPTQRPTKLSREKSLPPLPPGEAPAQILPSDRPRTMYAFDPRALPPGSAPAHDFLPPQAPFRNTDVRRQSFGGTSSRPNLGLQTMPNTRHNGFNSPRTLGPNYDEFGISRRSLGKLDAITAYNEHNTSPLPSAKRKSKFGFASLLGKKSDKREQDMAHDNGSHPFPSMGYSPYNDTQEDMTTNGYATSTSRHSAFSLGPTTNSNPNTRMSVTSRKALEELVQQDPDFVAYRYPSNDQRLDLLR